MKHSIEDIRKALEFYNTRGVHGNKIMIPIGRKTGPYTTSFRNTEFSLRELKLYNSKLGRAMYDIS